MTNEEFSSLLTQYKVAIVHFSHYANMREDGIFPKDLHNAIANLNRWPLSCCAITPNHKMDLPGSVGIILLPLKNHVISVLNNDSGSTTLENGDELSGGESLTCESFKHSLNVVPGRYNEWRVLGAKVCGIYIENPNHIHVKQKTKQILPFEEFEDINAIPVSLDFIKQSFAEFRFYTMSTCGLVEI